MTQSAYSFLDVQARISGPGGSFSLGSDAGAADEGITLEMAEDKNTMTVGAGGTVMHSLHGSNAGKITVRLLKTSPVNAMLSQMYAVQKASSANWGQNVITVSDVARGDFNSGRQCAFTKNASNAYAKDGNIIEWEFMVGHLDMALGSGTPALALN